MNIKILADRTTKKERWPARLLSTTFPDSARKQFLRTGFQGVKRLLWQRSLITNNDQVESQVSTGTTLVAVEFEGGVVIGADSRTSMVSFPLIRTNYIFKGHFDFCMFPLCGFLGFKLSLFTGHLGCQQGDRQTHPSHR